MYKKTGVSTSSLYTHIFDRLQSILSRMNLRLHPWSIWILLIFGMLACVWGEFGDEKNPIYTNDPDLIRQRFIELRNKIREAIKKRQKSEYNAVAL